MTVVDRYSHSGLPTIVQLDNLTQLAALRPPAVDPLWIWVASVRAFFYIDKTSLLAADGISVLMPVDFIGRWIRASGGDPVWHAQVLWYYDATLGSDENPGTQAAPIKSIGELMRRMVGSVVFTAATLHVAAALGDSEAALFGILAAGSRQWTLSQP